MVDVEYVVEQVEWTEKIEELIRNENPYALESDEIWTMAMLTGNQLKVISGQRANKIDSRLVFIMGNPVRTNEKRG